MRETFRMDMLRISHAFISFLSLSYAIVVTTPRLKRDLQTDELNPGIKEGVLREALTGSDTSSKKQDCGATALRLNMDLNRVNSLGKSQGFFSYDSNFELSPFFGL